jgi:hypothetical protein
MQIYDVYKDPEEAVIGGILEGYKKVIEFFNKLLVKSVQTKVHQILKKLLETGLSYAKDKY